VAHAQPDHSHHIGVLLGFKATTQLIAAFKIEQRGHAYVINARALTRGDVRITQDVSLNLQILQTVLDYITDADDSGELAIAQHRHVAHAMARHELHHVIDTLVGGHGDHAVSHDFLHKHRRGTLAVARKCMDDFPFGDETKNCLPTRHHESADIFYAQPVRPSRLVRPDASVPRGRCIGTIGDRRGTVR
jgi:hypothetical protein